MSAEVSALQLFLQRGGPEGKHSHLSESWGTPEQGTCPHWPCPCPQVTGVVSDSQGKAHYVLSGSWDEQMECAKIVQSSPSSPSSDGKQKTVYQTLPAKLLWKKYPLP